MSPCAAARESLVGRRVRRHGESTAATRASPRRPPPNNTRRTNGSSGSPTPPWLWLLLLGGFGLIFYQFVPKAETAVQYYPWFYEQVQADNIKSISPQGLDLHGELRKEQFYQSAPNQPQVSVKRFVTNAPSEASVDAVVQKLIELDAKRTPEEKKGGDGTRIDPQPATSAANGLLWMVVFFPAFIILIILYLFVRRARDQFDGGILGSFVKSPAKRHDKSKQRTTFDEVAGLENAKSRAAGDRRVPEEPREVPAAGRAEFPRGCS